MPRPPGLRSVDLDEVARRSARGQSVRQIARLLHTSSSSVHRALVAHRTHTHEQGAPSAR